MEGDIRAEVLVPAPTLWQRLGSVGDRADWNWLKALLVLALFTLVAVVLHRELEGVTWHDIRAAIAALSWSQLAGALLATAVSYLVLIGYDVLALRQLGIATIPAPLIALTSFVSQSFTFTLGFGVLTGGAVRLRLYGAAGLKPEEVAKISLLASAGFWLGLVVVTGLALVLAPVIATASMHLAPGWAVVAGLAMLAAVAAWLTYRSRARGLDSYVPDARSTALAVLIGGGDLLASAVALYVLLPADASIGFPAFVVIFAAALSFGLVSNVPGGLGVFEGVMVLSLPAVAQGPLLASLLAFRVIYYLVPMALAAALFAGFETRAKTRPITKIIAAVSHAIAPVIPTVAAAMVFMGGFVLLVSGALPAEQYRVTVLRHVVPLPFVEASHFVASIVGALLLIIAHGLARRLESAWRAALVLLGVGALFSLMKGIDYEEAIICLFVSGLLIASRDRFYRQGGLFARSPDATELVAIAIAIGISIWIGLMTYRDVAYSKTLWWDFSYHADAPRFLRATVGVAVTALLVMAYELLHRPSQLTDTVSAEDTEKAAALVARSPRTDANLALLGDKRFLFGADGGGFVMYGVQGWSWVSMGDPVADTPEATAALVWQFKELVDLHAGVPVFYQVSAENLPIYLDAGFSLVKLGEEAIVDLSRFTLEGGEGRKLRQAKAKAERSGARVEIVPAAEAVLMPGIKQVSDAWLAARHQNEKGFSLGFWSDAYLSRFDIAVIRCEGRVAAFANIWRSADFKEYSVDVMRVAPEAPQGAMDLLFISLMERAKAEGYATFNLGMAPLSGLPQHRLAPLWLRLAHGLFRYGERFYRFEGLRAYKNKFHPAWRPKYLAYPGGLRLPQVLIDITTLIAVSPQRAAGGTE